MEDVYGGNESTQYDDNIPANRRENILDGSSNIVSNDDGDDSSYHKGEDRDQDGNSAGYGRKNDVDDEDFKHGAEIGTRSPNINHGEN